ncbi:hypothetical protein, partial [Xenorhabdus entomophaga]|uniref:hypothetical protein n=1 Tax=Xenorhabdus entomophaga TaxID=3136257 RepID=UPI0030F3E39C
RRVIGWSCMRFNTYRDTLRDAPTTLYSTIPLYSANKLTKLNRPIKLSRTVTLLPSSHRSPTLRPDIEEGLKLSSPNA